MRVCFRGWTCRIIPAHAGFTTCAWTTAGRPGDHPRTRGVYHATAATASCTRGSSPHTRGLRSELLRGRDELGIIPAHAGFTSWRCAGPWPPRDHPRTRGVYSRCDLWARVGAGSSPHTRGLPAGPGAQVPPVGIIPAHAGFTRRGGVLVTGPGDHPRTRGVYIGMYITIFRFVGSSPHTRGLPQHLRARHHRTGIIPAHAGFTTPSSRPAPSSPDHPRTRGVYLHWPFSLTAPWGSSPHTRGLLHTQGRQRAGQRIIPAHAGFTVTRCTTRLVTGDHPRTRGVYSDTWSYCAFTDWIIPAHAGFTPLPPTTSTTTRDHPRTRGVYIQLRQVAVQSVGSSPHTRGLRGPLGGVLRVAQERIIPAHAGFTWSRTSPSAASGDHPRTRGVYREQAGGHLRERRIIPAHAGFTR